jgi:hypothetical protein
MTDNLRATSGNGKGINVTTSSGIFSNVTNYTGYKIDVMKRLLLKYRHSKRPTLRALAFASKLLAKLV